jgi:hypothetical protein
MLASQLSHLPLLPFLEHHPHPTYVVPDDWFAPTAAGEPSSSTSAANEPLTSAAIRRGPSASTSRGTAEVAPVWLNEAAKATALSPGVLSQVRSVVRQSRAAGRPATASNKEPVAKRPPLLHLPLQGLQRQETPSTASSEASSDGGTARPALSASPDESDSDPPPAPTVLGGRYTAIIIDVAATNYRVLQLVPCVSNPSPTSSWGMAEGSSRGALSSPSTSDVSPPDLLAQSVSTFAGPSSPSSPSPTSEYPSPSDTASPVSELPAHPAAPSACILSDRAPAMPSTDDVDRRRRQEYRMADMTANYDWSQTALGPLEAWPQSLKTIVSVVLNTHSESCLWWGPGECAYASGGCNLG